MVLHRNSLQTVHQLRCCACVASCSSRSFLLGCPWFEMVLTYSFWILYRFVLKLAFHLFYQRLSVHVQCDSSWLMMSLHPPPATRLSAGSGHGLTRSSLWRLTSAVQISEQLSVFVRLVGTQIHMSRKNERASVFPQRHDLSCPQVDDAWLLLREEHVMTCSLETVHTDQSSRHRSDFEYTSLHGAQIGPPTDGYFALFLDLMSSCACARFSSSHTQQHRCRRQPLL